MINKKNKKLIATIIFAEVVIVLLICTAILLPKLFPQKSNTSSSSAIVSSKTVVQRTFEEMVSISDTVISGSIIKADFDNTGVLYTMNVVKVYKGRNYTSMGYAYVTGKQTLSIGKTYLFIGLTGAEKYHYIQPFTDAPWIFSVNEDGSLTGASNGNAQTVSDIASVNMSMVQSYCDII